MSYTDSKGKRHTATVTAIAGTGASGFKTLDLTYPRAPRSLVVGEPIPLDAFDGEHGKTATNVPHKGDHESGEGFWLMEGEEVASTTRTPKARRRKRGK